MFAPRMSASEVPATLAELVPSELCVTLADGRWWPMTILRVGRPETQTAISKQCDLWAFVWASSSVLGDLVVQCLAPAPCVPIVVEIGAGSGVGGLAAAAFTTTGRVVCTDLVPDALRLIEMNAAALGCSDRLSTRQLDWGKFDAAAATLDELLGPADAPALVVGADICYIGSNIRPILRLFQHALRVPGRYALLVDPGRPFRDDLEDAASDFGLRVAVRQDFADLPTPVACMKACTVFLLARADDANCGGGAPSGALGCAGGGGGASPVAAGAAATAVECVDATDSSPGGILLSRLRAALERLAARRPSHASSVHSPATARDVPTAASTAGAACAASCSAAASSGDACGGAAAAPVSGASVAATPPAGPSIDVVGAAVAASPLPVYATRSGYTLPSVSRPP